MDAHSNYDIQNSVLHDSYGTNKKPYIFAITNGQKHDSVIAHCKIGDKFYRYMRHKIMKKSVYMRCSHRVNKPTENTHSSGFVRRCTSRVHLVPKAGHEHIIKKTERKVGNGRNYTFIVSNDDARNVSLWDVCEKDYDLHSPFCQNQVELHNQFYDSSKIGKDLKDEKKKYTKNGKWAHLRDTFRRV